MEKTVLNEWHAGNGAAMTDFNGWHMPLYYKGITHEHQHTRSSAGLFDLGHMGRLFVRGPDAYAFVDYLTPAKVSAAKPGEVQYSFLLRENGTVIDDITVYYGVEDIFLVINAGNRERDLQWINGQAEAFDGKIEIDNRGESWGMLALQGPLSTEIATKVLGKTASSLAYYHFTRLEHSKYPGEMIISRTGYTGEDGFEIYLPAEYVSALWNDLIAADPEGRVQPIGLAARDSLRLEAAMPLYGHELDDSLTPLHAGFGRFMDMQKKDFIGRAALDAIKEAGGPDTRLVGFELMQRGPVARQGFPVLNADGNCIGTVTSGIFSPTLKKTVGLAYVNKEHSAVGDSISIDIRGRALPAQIIKRPFYRRNA